MTGIYLPCSQTPREYTPTPSCCGSHVATVTHLETTMFISAQPHLPTKHGDSLRLLHMIISSNAVSEMTYTVSSGTLNPTIPYHIQQCSTRIQQHTGVRLESIFSGLTLGLDYKGLRLGLGLHLSGYDYITAADCRNCLRWS